MLSRHRRTFLGIPVGKRSRHGNSAVRIATTAATALAAVPAARRGLQAAGKAVQGLSASNGDSDHDKPKLAHLIEEHTDIAVPRSVAYNQWTQMEMLPNIVKGVARVQQEDDDKTVWISKIGPARRTWTARITQQIPDERIAWKSEGGPEHEGVVTFHSIDDDLTRVLIQMHYRPRGPIETIANELRIQRRRVRRDLRLFKHFLELRGEETGEWRGRIGSDGSPRSTRKPTSTRRRERSR